MFSASAVAKWLPTSHKATPDKMADKFWKFLADKNVGHGMKPSR
jgi:hypothetical protein